MKHARIGLLAFLVALIPSQIHSQQLDSIVVGGPPSESMKAVYYGQRSGLFRRYGLDVQITQINSGSAAMAAVVSGSFDLAHANLLSDFEAYERGVHFVVVAPSGLYLSDRPQAILIVRKDSPIQTGSDLNGKVIGASSLEDINADVTLAWIDQHGGDSKTVRVVELTNSSILPAIDDNRIAAATITAPFTDLALQSGIGRELGKSYDSIAKEFEISGFIGIAENLAKKKDAVRRFALAMHEAILYTNSHPAEVVDLVSSYSGVTVDVLKKSARTVDPEYVLPKYIQPFIDFAAKYHLIPHGLSAADVISEFALKPGR